LEQLVATLLFLLIIPILLRIDNGASKVAGRKAQQRRNMMSDSLTTSVSTHSTNSLMEESIQEEEEESVQISDDDDNDNEIATNSTNDLEDDYRGKDGVDVGGKQKTKAALCDEGEEDEDDNDMLHDSDIKGLMLIDDDTLTPSESEGEMEDGRDDEDAPDGSRGKAQDSENWNNSFYSELSNEEEEEEEESIQQANDDETDNAVDSVIEDLSEANNVSFIEDVLDAFEKFTEL
jgi:hypothetical protein